MITEKSNRLQVIVITDYDYPISVGPTSPMLHTKSQSQFQKFKVPEKGPCVNMDRRTEI